MLQVRRSEGSDHAYSAPPARPGAQDPIQHVGLQHDRPEEADQQWEPKLCPTKADHPTEQSNACAPANAAAFECRVGDVVCEAPAGATEAVTRRA
jgi:hypothetical protein